MPQEIKIEKYVEDFDFWIKTTNRRVSVLTEQIPTIIENVKLTQHNYELIYELKDELEEIKQTLIGIKLVQLLMAKENQRPVPLRELYPSKDFNNQPE